MLGCSVGWLTVWCALAGWLAGWLFKCRDGWLLGRLVGCPLADKLTGWLMGSPPAVWSFGFLVPCVFRCLVVRSIGC